VTALSPTDLTDYADERFAEAQRTIEAHTTSAYTGICLGCGRPGPCEVLTAAQEQARRYGRSGLPVRAVRPAPLAAAVTSAACGMEELRQAMLAAIAAADRTAAHLAGVPNLHRRLAPWEATITAGWQALGLVHAGLAHARRLPDTPGGNAADLLAGLRTARADADRAATLAAGVRLRLTVAEDQLRRTGSPAALVAAREWAAAIARLDLLTARLAVRGRALDRYADSLTGVPANAPAALPIRPPDRVGIGQAPQAPVTPWAGPSPVPELVAAAAQAVRLVASAKRRTRSGIRATVRHYLRLEARA
jgi:hypothetical protein